MVKSQGKILDLKNPHFPQIHIEVQVFLNRQNKLETKEQI